MLRVKISLVYIVLLGLMIGASVGLIHVGVGDLAVSETTATLQQAVVGVEQSARLEEASLLARAQFVARSDRLYRSLQGEFIGNADEEGKDDEKPKPSDAEFEGQRHLDADEKLKAQKFHLDDIAKRKERSVLTAEPHELDIFMVLDEKGKGVAALGKDLYSWFGSDVSKQFPEVLEVAKGGEARNTYWMWSFKPGEEKRLYRVALAPLRRNADEKPAGVVVLGSMIGDGLAKRKRELFGGAVDRDNGVHLAFFNGDSIAGSTFDTTQQLTVAAALASGGLTTAEPTDVTEVSVDGVPYLAVSRPLMSTGKPVGIAVIASLEDAKAPMTAMRVDVVLIGTLILILGLVLIIVLIHRYIKPVENLEDGVQEIIAGNRDYVWQPIAGHQLQSGLAQQLNFMSAFLQGKPMPDDDATGQGWGDLMPGGGDAPPQAPGQVQGVDLAGLMGAKKSDDGGNG